MWQHFSLRTFNVSSTVTHILMFWKRLSFHYILSHTSNLLKLKWKKNLINYQLSSYIIVLMQDFFYVIKYLTRFILPTFLNFVTSITYSFFQVSSVGIVNIVATSKNTQYLISYRIQNIQFAFIDTNRELISIAKSTS